MNFTLYINSHIKNDDCEELLLIINQTFNVTIKHNDILYKYINVIENHLGQLSLSIDDTLVRGAHSAHSYSQTNSRAIKLFTEILTMSPFDYSDTKTDIWLINTSSSIDKIDYRIKRCIKTNPSKLIGGDFIPMTRLEVFEYHKSGHLNLK